MRFTIAVALCGLIGCGGVSSPGTDASPEPDAGTDGDEDGVADAVDNCPELANPGQENGDRRPAATATAIPFAFRPTPTAIAVTKDDQISDPLPIGFSFTFFGQTFEEVHVDSNGLLLFEPNVDATGDSAFAQAIPSRFTPNRFVAGYWADLDPSQGKGRVAFELQGKEPNREFVVEWTDVTHFEDDGRFPVTMQIVLREQGSAIEFHCQSCPTDGEPHTQGVEDLSGLFGLSLNGRSERNFSLDEDGVRFETSTAAPDDFGDGCDLCADLWTADEIDTDQDGIGDACDNCGALANETQADEDFDRIGDDCDSCPESFDDFGDDDDEDGVGNVCDSCPDDPDPGQEDRDEDFTGDVCDNCPDVPNPGQEDDDEDGTGDACES